MPEKMVYEWDNKRDECFDLYITQNKSLEEIIDFYKGQNFAPRYVVDSTALVLRQPLVQMLLRLPNPYLTTSDLSQECCTSPGSLLETALCTRSHHLNHHIYTRILISRFIVNEPFKLASKNGNSQPSTALHTRMPILQ